MLDYKVGDIIEYTPFGGGTRRVEVTHREADIKNGRPGFDGTLVGASHELGQRVWGYDRQITRVVKTA
jgi:hypothetical protein